MALVRATQQTSSSNTSRCCRYHVFLSFRGEDTRKTFTDHLFTALVNAGFRTFRDDDELERGEDIKPELQKAIKHSRTSVIVFSKAYASSRWCLDELVMILERKRTSPDYFVLPVFYDVDPSHVRNQTGSLARAFARHQKSQHPKKVKAWKDALAEVADLAGMVLQNQADGHESKFINKIVQVIGEKLRRRPLSVPHIMIGRHSLDLVNELNLWLQDGSDDVGIFVIYGISGIGKTTIAKFVYNSNYERFEGSSFLENIKKVSQQPNGLVQLQTQLLSDILNGRKLKISSVSEGLTEIEDAISSKKVLLVLDDVDHMDQLDAVFRMKDPFYPGSKIILTTRHARLLRAQQVTTMHKVETLDDKESLELFSWHAFGQDHPIEGYIEYSQKIVGHCGGLPLALKVLGSSMYLRDSIAVWKSALEKLEAIPNGEIVNKLRVSYDSLQDDHDRNLFQMVKDRYQYQPGVYLLSERQIPIPDPIWFNKILGDSDDEDTTDKEENHNMMSISTDSSYDDRKWYNKRLGDSDEEDNREEDFSRFVRLPDEEEEQQDDITVATTTGSNNSGGLCGWKVLAACFCCPVGMKM